MSEAQVTESGSSANTQSDSNTGSSAPPAQTTPPPQTQSNSGGTGTQDLTALVTTLTALPEQIARSVKEAVGTPAKPAETPASKPPEGSEDKGKGGQDSGDSKGNQSTAGATTKTPGRKSFTDWWFN